jgi:hypothetical protein
MDLGVELTSRKPLGRGKGYVIEMSSGKHSYELGVSDAQVWLGRVGMDGRRTKLFEGSPWVENEWAKMFGILQLQERSETHKAGRIRC